MQCRSARRSASPSAVRIAGVRRCTFDGAAARAQRPAVVAALGANRARGVTKATTAATAAPRWANGRRAATDIGRAVNVYPRRRPFPHTRRRPVCSDWPDRSSGACSRTPLACRCRRRSGERGTPRSRASRHSRQRSRRTACPRPRRWLGGSRLPRRRRSHLGRGCSTRHSRDHSPRRRRVRNSAGSLRRGALRPALLRFRRNRLLVPLRACMVESVASQHLYRAPVTKARRTSEVPS